MTLIPFTPKTTGMIPFTPGKLPVVNTPAPIDKSSMGYKMYGDRGFSTIKKTADAIPDSPDLSVSIKNRQDSFKSDVKQYVDKPSIGGALGLLYKTGANIVGGASDIAFKGMEKVPILSEFNKVIGKGFNDTVNFIGDKVGDIPAVQKYASSLTPAQYDSWVKNLKATSDYGAFSLLAVGAEKSKLNVADVVDKTKDLTGKVKTKLEGTTPAKLNDYIDKKYQKAIPSSSKKSIALTDTQMENNREAMKLITDNKENLKFENQAGTYDTGRLPENIVEHAQAVTQTRQGLWDKMSSLLKDKNVSISLQKPLEMIQAKIKQLGASASETPYLQALYDKYSKTPMATVDQMNTFIKDLNNDAEPFFKSGSDKSKATASASVGNLFRDQLDTTAQQIGTPEVSLLRKQYGAMASTEADIAKALNKQLKGTSGGASGLADLFSGEEIARGIITGDPSAIVSGLSLQATKKFLKFLGDPNRIIKNLYSKIDEVSAKGGVPRMTSSFGKKDKAGLPMVKGQDNPTQTPPVINLPGKIGGFDEPQAKNIGLMTKPPTKVAVPNAPEGHYLNIEMIKGTTTEKITEVQMKSKFVSALPKDVKMISYKIVDNNFVPTLSRALTDTEMSKVLKATEQKAIPQLSNGVGTMHGSNEWGDFNKNYFKGVEWKKKTMGEYSKSQGYEPLTGKLPTIK